MTMWPTSTEQIQSRYRHLARIYPAFEVFLALPPRSRERAVGHLGLRQGSSVLEIGCGTGRNLDLLRRAVGPSGRVIGVDATPEMIAVARSTIAREGWTNVELICADAAEVPLPSPVDGVLFSLSLSVIPQHRVVLDRAWSALRPGGRLVVLDGKLPRGFLGALVRPLFTFLSQRSVFGNPERAPWEHLRELRARVDMEEFQWGSYYLCTGNKPE